MSLRFRKSMKLMPGVRLSFNKDSVGMSLGVPGARYTVNSKGRRTVTTGLPGTGLYSVNTLSSGRTSRARRPEAHADQPLALPAAKAQPGIFAKKSEKELYALLKNIYAPGANLKTSADVINVATALSAQYPELQPALELISILHGITDSSTSDEAAERASNAWSQRATLFGDSLVKKYLSGIYPGVPITRGIFTSGSFDAQCLGFILSEVLQTQAKYEEALAVLHEMVPNQLVAISIADLEVSAENFDGAIETTEDIENEDDATAMLLVLRGIAFREKGLDDAAIECLKRALAKKSRSEGVLHRALYERAMTYSKMGKKAMAKKDLEKILVDEPNAEGVSQALAALGVDSVEGK